jgi:flagellar motor protein MotB
MTTQTVKQLQQSEIFFVLFLIIILAAIILWPKPAPEVTPPKKPPIITLPEASGYTFKSGSAELSGEFQEKLLTDIIPGLKVISDSFHVDVIEVIGHTDGQIVGIAPEKGNIDEQLEDAANSSDTTAISGLVPQSNADLGLMRALAIIKFIENKSPEWIQSRRIRFRPYSAAQLLLPDGQISKVDRIPDAKRRRIEIRFTRLTD